MKGRKIIIMLCMLIVMLVAIPTNDMNVSFVSTVEAATKVKLNKKKATLYVGDSLTLKVTGTKTKVKWSSNKKSVATVSSKGKYKGKVKAKKAGTATITAQVGKKKYKCKITVIAKEKEETTTKEKDIPVSAIVLNETNKTIVIGTEFTLSATVVPSNAKDSTITWQSIDSNIATVNNGVVKAIGVGTTQIYASSNSGVSVFCTVTVTRDYLAEFNALSKYEKAGVYSIFKIDKTMKAESKSYTIVDGYIGVFARRDSVLSEYEVLGEASVKITYQPSDFLNGIVPNFIVCMLDDGRLLPYGMQGDKEADIYTEYWKTSVNLGQSNTLSAPKLYEIFIGLQQSGYDEENLCTN